MGIFWDLMQESKLEEQEAKASSLEERVNILEKELEKTRKLMTRILIALEEHIQVDIDGDGKKGA